MFRIHASYSHSYTHLILAMCIVSEPTYWVFITSKYPGIHDIGLPNHRRRYADTEHTQTRTGYNPMLEDYGNTAFLISSTK